uniref:Exocyst subunit Exo70 family protein n=1 Tax=Hordeum vulgare subsp. vulgare TaxID=112509 RepID=F2D3P9_HORVV|nr:predicted protein [Hordeum vulgare subsp. vulgare]
MAGRLAAVPELTTAGFTTPSPPLSVYRESIRSVAVSGGKITATVFSHSGNTEHSRSGDSGSGASGSYPSNNSGSGSSSGSVHAAAADYGAHELTKIARRMVSDGYTQRMVSAFEYGSGSDRALEAWFFELDVDWVLQLPDGDGSWRQFQIQDLVKRWIRAFITIVASIKEVAINVHEATAVAQFGKASIAKMFVFIDAITFASKEEKLRAVLDMYICVSSAEQMFSPEVQVKFMGLSKKIFMDIGGSLPREVKRLSKAIYSTVMEVRAFAEEDDSWAIEIPRGRGDIHRNTWLMVNCIKSMQDKARHHETEYLRGLIADSVRYLKDLLLRKSEQCSDQSLRYLFLLNNSYLVAMMVEPWSLMVESWSRDEWRPAPECLKYMNEYLHVSWGHVQSHIPKMAFMDGYLDGSRRRLHMLFCMLAPLQHRKNTASLAKFESAFHKTYEAQKFWKVPNPQLRDELRRTIIERVVSGYRCYLEKHPKLEKQVRGGSGSSSPDVFEEMLGELFEG